MKKAQEDDAKEVKGDELEDVLGGVVSNLGFDSKISEEEWKSYELYL